MIKNRSLLRSIEKDHLETFAALTRRPEIEKPVCWRRPVRLRLASLCFAKASSDFVRQRATIRNGL